MDADVLALLPALSTAVPVTTCRAVSVETTIGAAQLAMPLPPRSAHVKVVVTGLLFQPAVFADGVLAAVIAGGVVSTTTLIVADDCFPLVSVARAVMVFEPSPAVSVT